MSTKTTAADAYADKFREVMENLVDLKIHVENHAMRQHNDRSNWGFVGDLDMINALLLRALGRAE